MVVDEGEGNGKTLAQGHPQLGPRAMHGLEQEPEDDVLGQPQGLCGPRDGRSSAGPRLPLGRGTHAGSHADISFGLGAGIDTGSQVSTSPLRVSVSERTPRGSSRTNSASL